MSPADQENDSLSSLEERIQRAVQLVSRLRQEREAAVQEAAQAKREAGVLAEEVRQVRHRTAIFGQVHHRPASDAKMARDAQMAAHHVDEHRIALRRPNGGGVSDHPKQQPRDP